MHRTDLWLLLAAAALPAFAPAAAAASVGAVLPVALRPDLATAALRRLVLQPASHAAGVPVALVPWGGETAALIEADAATLQAGCAAGRFAAAAWPAALRAGLVGAAPEGCALAVATRSTVLAWDRGRLPGPPGWDDFWDVARHPGRRGMQQGPRGNLEIALLADGVPAGEIYRTLATPAGLDRAFRKLDQLRPYILWWRREDEPARLLASGGVLLTTAPAERVVLAAHAHANLALTYDQSLFTVDGWALAGQAGSTEGERARRLGVGLVAPSRLAAYASAAGLGSPADTGRVRAALRIDEAFWAANTARLTTRFAGWLRS